MSSLRLVLLAVGIVFLIALAWWERRRPRQASDRSAPLPMAREFPAEAPSARVREGALPLPEMRAHEPLPTHALPSFETDEAPTRDAPGTDEGEDRGTEAQEASEAAGPHAAEEPTVEARPLEPPAEVLPAELVAEPSGAPGAVAAPVLHEAPPAAVAPAPELPSAATPEPPQMLPPPPASREALPELPGAAAPRVEWPPDPERRVVALRLVAMQPDRFAGRSLRQALAAEGFVLGRFDIFHKPDAEHRAVLSAAGLHRPGTFDPDTMDSQHFGGLSLFAVLPGPKPPPQAFDELVFTARSLNERLHGVLQDEQGGPLTPARIATLRERLKAGATS